VTELSGRCGGCARFVRVRELIDENGEVRRAGECLLGVWPSPLYEERTCNKYVAKGMFKLEAKQRAAKYEPLASKTGPAWLSLPEDLLSMDADEFRAVLKQVLREELATAPVDLSPRFRGGEMVIRPGKEGTQEKRVPLEAFFHKIVMLRDKLRVLESKINGNDKLADEDKVQLQQYITGCYGTLTTFNVLFADKDDGFVGQKTVE
jgi:hypothetical protein